MPQTGTAWVPVYPDTRRVDPETRRAFSRLGPFGVDVTPQIKDLPAVRRALASIPSIPVPVDVDDRELTELRARLQALGDRFVGINISSGDARAEIADIAGRLDRLSGQTARVDVAVDAGAASASLQTAEREVSRLDGRTAQIQIIADAARFVAAAGVVISLVNQLDGQTVSIQVVADTGRAIAGMAMVAARAGALGGAVGGVAALGSVVAGLGPAGAVAAGGLGAAVLASGGVGKALTALGAQQDAAGKDAQASAQKQAQAAQQVQGAQERLQQATANVASVRQKVADDASRAATQVSRAEAGVAQATEQARSRVAQAVERGSRAIAAAERQQATAQRNLDRATSELKVAQFELTEAWEEGRRSLQDLQDQVDGNALDQRQAAFDLRDAEKELAAARASGDTDQIERAQLAYDRQVETIDQLNKQTQRLAADNAEAQSRGIDGSDAAVAAQEREFAALERFSDAQRAAGDASAAVDQARMDSSNEVARAREEGDRSIASARQALADAELAATQQERQGREQLADANRQVVDAQKALQEALASTAVEASATQQALQTAFSNLSPAAASFALYLWSLKGLFDQLRATAASGFFPPIQAGLQALVGQFSVFQTVVGQFATAMGNALGYVLTQLASPFWTSFFSILGAVAGPILMQLFVVLMQVAQAAAGLIVALLPFAPMALDMLGIVGQLIAVWTPFIALLVGQLLPVAGLVLQALMPLGPLLGALAPILAVLGQMFATVLGALLQALVPVIVALTPLIQQLALAWGQQLVGAIVAVTPLLVAVATFMSQHPQLVMGVITVLAGLFAGWQAITAVVSALLSPLVLLKIAMMATGLTATAIGGSFGAMLGTLSRSFGVWSLFQALLGFVRGALAGLASGMTSLLGVILRAIGPLGWIGLILGILYSQNEAFRGAVNGLLGVLMQLVGTILSSLMPVLDVLVQVMDVLGGVLGGVAQVLAFLLVPVVQALAAVLEWLTPVIVPLVQVFLAVRAAMMLWAAAQWALNIAMAANPIGLVVLAVAALVGAIVWAYQNFEGFRSIVDGVGQVFVWLWQTVLSPVVDFFRNVFGAVIAWVSSQWSWLSVVLLFITGPIGFLILAFTTFRDQTMAVFSAIGTAASWFWNTLLSPILSAIWTGLQFLGAILFTILVAPFLIAWNLISAAVSFAWTNILQPIWYGAIVPGLQLLGAVMTWLYTNVVLPIWNAIGAAISFVWNSIILPIWTALVWYVNNVTIPVMQFLYYNVILPIWNAIGAAISFVWNTIILPVWNAILFFINTILIPAMQFLYFSVIKPIWDAIGAAINFVWTNVIKPAWDAVWAGLQWLGDRFKEGTDRIGQIWNTIRGFLAKPINFMIDVVWNRGVVPAWNAVAGLVGLGPIQPLGMIPEAATGGRVDSAGMIRGPGTGTSDSILAKVGETDQLLKVSNREFIMNAEATRANYPALVAMNGGAEIGGPRRPVRALAGGGPVWPGLWNTVHAQFPNARMTSNYRPGDSGYHGRGMAVDVAGSYPMAVGQMKAINQWIGRTFPNSTELIHYPLFGGGINLKNGGPHLYNPKTQFEHQDHVHWAQDPAGPNGGGNGGSIGAIISTFFKDKAREAFDGITNPAINTVRRLIGDPPPAWRGAATALATKARDTVRDFVFRKADEKDAAASAGGGGAAMGPPTAGQIAHAREIAAAAQERGIGHEGFVIALMTGLQESGLRILANRSVPGSLSLPHEGIGGDHDSVGIFQQRQAGWGTLPMRMNARASAGMFFNKLGRGPYGDYGAAAQRVQVSAFPGAYSKWRGKAEEISRAVPYDDGGWALGKGVMLKDVIQPEKMLDPVESEAGYRPLVKLSAQLSQGQVPIASAETAAARAAALMRSDSTSDVQIRDLNVYDVDGALIGRMRTEARGVAVAELASAATGITDGRQL